MKPLLIKGNNADVWYCGFPGVRWVFADTPLAAYQKLMAGEQP